jgi:hypothetical protein
MRLPRAAALAAVLAAACTSPQPCPTPLEECDGQCVDLRSDPRHCGGCGSACAAAEGCLDGACGSEFLPLCPGRSGGAFVTLGACDDAVKVWITRPEFISAAEAAVLGPAPGVPVLAFRAGTDCDAQWTWTVDPASARFEVGAPSSSCALCPAQIQAAIQANAIAGGIWCPTGATILAVDRR